MSKVKEIINKIFKNIQPEEIKYQAWIDIETTGVNPYDDYILQVACIITDHHFNIIEEHEWVIDQDPELMRMLSDAYVINMHEQTGLWDRLDSGIPEAQVDHELYTLLRRFFPFNKLVSIGGNSVHFDLEFLKQHFEKTGDILSHRVLDMSAVLKFMRLTNTEVNLPEHTTSHDALDDIRWSITQARYAEGALK